MQLCIVTSQYGNYITDHVEYREKARFVYGESMGGAVALLIHQKQHNYWSGVVLVSPMCKVQFVNNSHNSSCRDMLSIVYSSMVNYVSHQTFWSGVVLVALMFMCKV